jgi:hypothetical protein
MAAEGPASSHWRNRPAVEFEVPPLRRVLLPFGFAIAVLIVAAFPTLAAGGKPERLPGLSAFVIEGGCSFDIGVTPTRQSDKTFVFPAAEDGTVKVLIAGGLFVELTNVETGDSLTANISGQGVLFFHPDGTATTTNAGRTLAWLIPEEGGPAAWVQSGHISWTIDASGLFTLIDQTGNTFDLCEALAPAD